jgi:hypothetical protein
MKSKVISLILGVLFITGIASSLGGCSSKASPNIQTLVDPIVKNILTSLNNNDYTAFIKNMDPTYKNTYWNPDDFDKTYSQMKTEVGDYQSADLYRAALTSNGDIITTNVNAEIHLEYFAQYSKEPDGVDVEMDVQSVNGAYKVQNLFFDSPILNGNTNDEEDVRAYADSEIENMLISLNNNDYSGYTKDFAESKKDDFSQTDFNEFYNQIKSTVGNYQTKKFEIADTQESNGPLVFYYARYALEPAGVWVVIVLDGNHNVTDWMFSSPKLNAKYLTTTTTK